MHLSTYALQFLSCFLQNGNWNVRSGLSLAALGFRTRSFLERDWVRGYAWFQFPLLHVTSPHVRFVLTWAAIMAESRPKKRSKAYYMKPGAKVSIIIMS